MRRPEVAIKLQTMREEMRRSGLEAIRLRGVDWFAWATGGGNSSVILTGDLGIAEVFVTEKSAFVLTNHIEAQRLRDEEVSSDFEVVDCPWKDGIVAYDLFVREQVGETGVVASDRPLPNERTLPSGVLKAKRTLLADEVARYREIGRDAGLAMKEALEEALPHWTEYDLAAAGARAMWKRGLHPTLTLVAGESRLKTQRHPFPTSSPLGGRAMLVYCARRQGLYANLTRFVYFRKPTSEEGKLHDDLFLIEERILAASRKGLSLDDGYWVLEKAYADFGHAGEIVRHHQGGTCGYLSRETVATPTTIETLDVNMAVAWNPSLAGAKLEDTFVIRENGLENLTEIQGWPSVKVDGLPRPSYFIKE